MEPGDVVADRFELSALRGRGGMGAVFEAIDRSTGERVALKQMTDVEIGDAARFAREARVLAELSHPAIVRYVAHGADEGGAWLAMEWLEGEDLSARLDRKPLSMRESIALGARIAEALGVAHARGIVHRDVKPANVFLVGGDPRAAKLLDFGIARRRFARTLDALPTRAGVLIGTPGYMAPEQARGAPDIDARADVFSLGCVLFECLTDRPAFVGTHPIAILTKVLMEDAPSIEELAIVPPGIARIVDAALAKDRAARPKDGSTLAADLLAELEHVGRDSLPGGGDRPPRASVPSPSLGGGELALASVVVTRLRHDTIVDTAATLASDSLPPGDPHAELSAALVRAIAAAGAHVERLSDAVVIALRANGVATDQAARAARIALLLRATHDGAATAMAVGRAPAGERQPIGEAIDRAIGLLAGASDLGGVRLDGATAGLLDARFVVRTEGQSTVLERERTTDGEVRTLLGKPTRCVGRERELSTLLATFDECASESVARVVVVTAPPGMGKSRVRHALIERITERSEPSTVDGTPALDDGTLTIWRARADVVGAGGSLGMLGAALRQAAGIQSGERLSVQRAKLRARVARHVAPERVDEVAIFVGEITGTRAPDSESPRLEVARRDAAVMVDQTRRAFAELVVAEASAAPLLLVLDDLHWGDPTSIGFVDAVLREHPDIPFMVLAFARPEVDEAFPELWAGRHPTRLSLGPLGKRAVHELVRGVLGARATPEVLDRIVARAEGNPFYVEELVRATAQGELDVPESVLAMVQSRIERLPPDARRVLRAASVFGQTFWRDALGALLGGERRTTDLRDWLRYLEDQELVLDREPPRFAGQSELVFRHALVRDAAYRTLLEPDRVLGHRLAGEWLLAAGEPDALTVAEHLDAGGAPERAREVYLRAARQALEGHELAQTIARADRGIACGAEGELLGELLLARAEAHVWRGETRLGEADAERAHALLPRMGLPWLLAANLLANSYTKLGEHDKLAALGLALREGTAAGARENNALMATRANTAAAMLNTGLYDEAGALMASVDASTSDPVARARIAAARAIATRDPGERVALRREAAEMWDLAGHARNACNQRVNVGHALLEVGRCEAAVEVFEQALAQAERWGVRVVASYALHNLGLALAGVGRLSEGRERETSAALAFVESQDARGEGSARTYLAEILTAAGDHEEAAREAEHAVTLLDVFTPLLPRALAALAQASLARGDLAGARAALERAMASLDHAEEGERAVRLAHAEVLHAAGERDAARAAIASARTIVLERADDIADPELRASFLASVPENARTLALASLWLSGS